MRRILFAAIGMVFAAVSASASLVPAFEYASSSTGGDARPFTIGFKFSLSGPVLVEALGYYDNGAAYSHEVGIWDAGGVLVAQTTVLPSDTLSGHFHYSMITPTTLAAGIYTIGGQSYQDGTPALNPTGLSGITTIPQYTWITDEQIGEPGLVFPTQTTDGVYGPNGIAAVNFLVEQGDVPEPASLALLGAGLFGLMRLRRRA